MVRRLGLEDPTFPADDLIPITVVQSFDVYQSDVGWAKNLEITSDIAAEGVREVSFQVPANYSFLLVAVAPRRGGKSAAGPDVRTEIWFPKIGDETKQAFLEPTNSPELLVHLEGETKEIALGIMKAPQEGQWLVVVSSEGKAPFSVHISAFDAPSLHKEVATYSQMPISFRCRACLATSKALGASLTVAAELFVVSQMPPALIDAVKSFLGVTAQVAIAFIDKILGESTDGIAQKFCEGIRLCERH